LELLKYKEKFKEYTYYMKDGEKVLHGLYRERYPNGQLEFEYSYKENKGHGRYRHWDKNGLLDSEYYFVEGIKYDKDEYEESVIMNRSW